MQNVGANPEKGPFGLEGGQYWKQPLLQEPARRFAFELVRLDVDGIFIDGPSKVYLDKHNKVPLACLRSGSMKKLDRFNFSTTAWLAVSHLESGRIHLVLPSVEVADPYAQPPSEGWTTVGADLDLGSIVDLGPKLGRYANVILCGPEASNQRILTLYPSEKAEGSKEFEKLLKDLRGKGGSPHPILVGKTLDLKHENGPAGDGPIWNLSASENPAGNRIRLDYRLEAPPRLVYATDNPQTDENGKRIHANLPLTLVGFDENRRLVLHVDLGLPVANPPAGESGKTILQGSASLSLSKLLGSRAPKKTLHIWALALDRFVPLEIPMGVR